MDLLPDPVWPMVLLAAISAVDAAISWRPVSFVAACWDAVRFPRRYWWLPPWIKIAAAIGLIAGVWIPVLGSVTLVCLVLYFVIAIAMHVHAGDLGRNLFVNATGMLLLCIAVLWWCFLA